MDQNESREMAREEVEAGIEDFRQQRAASDLDKRLAALEDAKGKANGGTFRILAEMKPGGQKLVVGMATALFLVAQSYGLLVYSLLTDRLDEIESTLKRVDTHYTFGPRYTTADQIPRDDCLERALAGVERLMLDRLAGSAEERPEILRDVQRCGPKIHRLRDEILKRQRAGLP